MSPVVSGMITSSSTESRTTSIRSAYMWDQRGLAEFFAAA
jgi:hypothetical protein